MKENNIEYPYMPQNRTFVYVSAENIFMIEAKKYAQDHSLDAVMPNASVLVKDGRIISKTANGRYQESAVRLAYLYAME